MRLFGKNDCSVCKQARAKVEFFTHRWQVELPVEYVSLDTPDGLAEGAFHDVYDIPTMVLLRGAEEVQRWVKFPPRSEELKALLGVE